MPNSPPELIELIEQQRRDIKMTVWLFGVAFVCAIALAILIWTIKSI